MSQGPTRPSESQNQSPYTEFPKSLLIRRDLVKMPKALRAEINDVVVKYTDAQASKGRDVRRCRDGTRNDPEPR